LLSSSPAFPFFSASYTSSPSLNGVRLFSSSLLTSSLFLYRGVDKFHPSSPSSTLQTPFFLPTRKNQKKLRKRREGLREIPQGKALSHPFKSEHLETE